VEAYAFTLQSHSMPAVCRAYEQPSPPQPGSLVLWIDIIDVALEGHDILFASPAAMPLIALFPVCSRLPSSVAAVTPPHTKPIQFVSPQHIYSFQEAG